MSRPALILLLGTIAGTAAWIGSAAARCAEPAAGPVHTASQVSDVFRAEYHEAASSVPPVIWSEMTRLGWKVVVAEFVTDAAPDLESERPRGWPGNVTWQQVEAAHLPAQRWLVLAEKRRQQDGAVVANRRIGGTLRHELGHIFDALVAGNTGRYRSSAADFQANYAADVAEMPAETRSMLHYYLQSQEAGRQETFAEAFAISLGGGSDTGLQVQFVQGFPRVNAHVQNLLAEYSGGRADESPGGGGEENPLVRRFPRFRRVRLRR
jgi:hypothetical protein